MTTVYKLSFTAGGLFLSEARVLVALHAQLNDWSAVKVAASTSNALQSKTVASGKRFLREATERVSRLSANELRLFQSGGAALQGYLMWVAACRHYPIVAAFAVEVLHERFLTMSLSIGYDDFDHFFHKKAEQHAELDSLAESSRKKLRQVLFRMMREAGLLSASNAITPSLLPPILIESLISSAPAELSWFPMPPVPTRNNI